ncbi:acetoacetate--CoA ligase [Streptomyces sp. NPDC003393]
MQPTPKVIRHSAPQAGQAATGAMLRAPSADVHTGAIGRYRAWLSAEHSLSFTDYAALWRWSIAQPEAFWASIWDYFGVRARTPYQRVLHSAVMPGARWFTGATLNYAEHMLGDLGVEAADKGTTAVIAYSQTRPPIELSFGELRDQVARARAGLIRLGVGRGDRVAGYLPNIPEALVAFLATASLGAIWASCAPEFGARSVIDRLAQIEPTVLLTVSGYTYGPKAIDKRDDANAVRAGLPSVRHVVEIPYGPGLRDALTWDQLLASPGPLEFDPLPFHHPLCVLFSSGTTGLPKAIIHGHGGILVEHLKLHAFHLDTRPGDRLLWFTTTAWTMWNILVSGLLHGAAVVLYDGNPQWPDQSAQWQLAADTQATLLGTSPAYLMACRRAGVDPVAGRDLGCLRTLGVTGAPLPNEGYDWLHDQFADQVLVNSISGGTDVCSAFVAGSPWLPVFRGELSGPALGVDVAAFDQEGNEVIGQRGELVVRAPMPSMPIGFWGDEDGERYRSSYFDTFPGVWRHGDWAEFTARGSCVISGRSDATLNRGGVRLGTAEFYAVVDELPEIDDSLVVHLEDAGGTPGELLLFVVLHDGVALDAGLRDKLVGALRTELSPRHVPDTIEAVPSVPRTLTGKRLETPVKEILQGRSADAVVSVGSLADPGAIAPFVSVARRRAAGDRSRGRAR